MGIGSSTRRWDGSTMPSQKGNVVIVTGANCGIGFETAKALACVGLTWCSRVGAKAVVIKQ